MKKIAQGENPYQSFITEINESYRLFLFAFVKGANTKNSEVKFFNTFTSYFDDNDWTNTIKRDIDIFLHEQGASIKKRDLPGYAPKHIVYCGPGKDTFYYCPLNKGLVKKLSAYLNERYLKIDIEQILKDFSEGADGIIYR